VWLHNENIIKINIYKTLDPRTIEEQKICAVAYIGKANIGCHKKIANKENLARKIHKQNHTEKSGDKCKAERLLKDNESKANDNLYENIKSAIEVLDDGDKIEEIIDWYDWLKYDIHDAVTNICTHSHKFVK